MSRIKYLSSSEAVSMEDRWFDIATLDHFWVKWRYEFFKLFVKKQKIDNQNLFEIGCGHGLVINQIESEYNAVVHGCDLNAFALGKIKNNKGNLFCYNIFQKEPRFKGYFDGIILFDVIEHIENDVEFIENALFHLKEGGSIMINVPAINGLFSSYDEVLGHKRRYSKSLLYKKLEILKLKEIDVSYWGFSLVPVLALRKLILFFKRNDIANDGFKAPNKVINAMFSVLMKIELKLTKSPIIGASVMAIGTK